MALGDTIYKTLEPASIGLSSQPLRPILKWAGGKRWQVPYLVDYYARSNSERLVELFGGGMAVSLAFRPKKALINDINPHLINFYKTLKSGNFKETPLVNDEETFYGNREAFNELIKKEKFETPEAASYFYYLNKTCFNGLCRFNKKGEFNVPYGKYTRGLKYENNLSEYKEQFKFWEFSTGDFTSISLKETDFVYADPPYDVDFQRYTKEGFGWEDQVRIAEFISSLESPSVLVNQATDRIVDLYTKLGFSISFVDAPRSISCNGDRRAMKEVIALMNID